MHSFVTFKFCWTDPYNAPNVNQQRQWQQKSEWYEFWFIRDTVLFWETHTIHTRVVAIILSIKAFPVYLAPPTISSNQKMKHRALPAGGLDYSTRFHFYEPATLQSHHVDTLWVKRAPCWFGLDHRYKSSLKFSRLVIDFDYYINYSMFG